MTGGSVSVAWHWVRSQVPWQAFDVDSGGFVLNVTKETLKKAPGFDEAQWPNMAEQHWAEYIHLHYTNTSNGLYQ